MAGGIDNVHHADRDRFDVESGRKTGNGFLYFLLLLESAMIGVFVSLDLLVFYLFFEASLVPMFFLIGIWGGENRIYAAVKFFIFTALGSLLMLVGSSRCIICTCRQPASAHSIMSFC